MRYIVKFSTFEDDERYSPAFDADNKEQACELLRQDAEVDLIEVIRAEAFVVN